MCGRSGGDIGGVPDEKWIQAEVSDKVKEERVSCKESGQAGVSGGGREERCRGRRTSAKGQHGNGSTGSEDMRRLGAGGRVSGGWLCRGGQIRQDAKRAVSNASGSIGRAPFIPDGVSPGRSTHNRSLRYQHLERPAHKVSGDRQNTR